MSFGWILSPPNWQTVSECVTWASVFNYTRLWITSTRVSLKRGDILDSLGLGKSCFHMCGTILGIICMCIHLLLFGIQTAVLTVYIILLAVVIFPLTVLQQTIIFARDIVCFSIHNSKYCLLIHINDFSLFIDSGIPIHWSRIRRPNLSHHYTTDL